VGQPALAHDLVRAAARSAPDAVAVVSADGVELTYGQLLDRWLRAAAGLRRLGVGPEVPVAVRVDRSIDLVVAMLAVFEAGGVYAPIDASCPPERFAAVLADLRAPVLLADGEPPAAVRAVGPRLVHPADLATGGQTGAAAAGWPRPDNLAYVLSTSGSTGQPKWVAMPHRGLARLIAWQDADGPGGLVTASFTATGFDVFFQETLSTLSTGGRLCLVGEDARRDPDRLLAVLDERGVQRVFLPYVALQQLALAAARRGRPPAALRHVITAGERLVSTEEIRWLFAALPDCRLDNHYGPTETHLVTRMTLDAGNRPWPEFPAIGTAVGGAEVHLVGADLTPGGAGTGEIHVGGDAVARGYLHSPALTAQRFRPDPRPGAAGGRLYRTGDLARRDADGTLHFLGRVDDQEKVRGYRVEPAEVELALSRHPAVEQAAAGVRELGGGVRGLVGYVVTGGEPVPVADLTGFLGRWLPAYMVPSRFVFLDALPRTPSGKVDRRALAAVPLPVLPEPTVGGAGGSVEAEISAIWKRVLGHDEFDAEDDFFDVGGDSLLAAWVVSELSELAGRDVDLSVLLEDSTVTGLARRIAGTPGQPDGERPDGGWLAAGPRPESEILTLRPGPAGRALFVFHALGGELLAYRELARRMSAPVRLLGLRWSGGADEPLSLEALAATHCRQIRLVRPHGPYLLAGWSFGGVLAMEAARQLSAAGERVEFLGLLDANPVLDPITGRPPARTPYLGLFTGILAEIDRRGLSGEQPVDVAELAANDAWADLMGNAATGVKVSHLRHNLTTARRALAALNAYVPRTYAGDVHLFQAGATGPEVRRELARQLRGVVAGEVRVRTVPGDHNSMLAAPDVSVLAEELDVALQGAVAADPDGGVDLPPGGEVDLALDSAGKAGAR
jgi:amino acid adenylation domain-containing protein